MFSRNKKTPYRQKWDLFIIRIFIPLLLLVTLAATVVLIIRGNEIARCLHPEVFKLLANLVITAGIGGVGGLVLNELNASRERREANRKILRTDFVKLVSLYNEVKSLRRRFRAQAIRPKYTDDNAIVLLKHYDSFLQELNESQLRLETHIRLLEGNMIRFSIRDELRSLLEHAESYLGDIITEWEEHRESPVLESSLEKQLSKLEHLTSFVKKEKEVKEDKKSFKDDFAEPMGLVFSIMAKEIMK